jgi:hypothetical protein
VQPRRRRLHLELALAHVLGYSGGRTIMYTTVPDGNSDRGRASDQHRVGDAPARIGIRVVDERQPHDHEDEDQQLDGV